MAKSRKEVSKLFFQNYYHYYVMVKCRRYVNLEEMDIELVQQKKYGSWVLRERLKEIIKQNIIMAVLRKVNSHSIVICRLNEM